MTLLTQVTEALQARSTQTDDWRDLAKDAIWAVRSYDYETSSKYWNRQKPRKTLSRSKATGNVPARKVKTK